MNIIEQLGGYANAKFLISAMTEGTSMEFNGVLSNMQQLCEVLLAYRRQHNIFDIGDKVVFKWVLESSDIFTIYSIDAYFIGVKRFEDDDFYYANINWGLKHATDAEIKAGRRL